MSPRITSSLVLAAVFLLGALTGGGIMTAANAKKLGRRYETHPPALRQRFILSSLEREVDLDAEQERKVESLLATYQTGQEDVRRELEPRMLALRSRLFDELRVIMRPDQLADFQRFVRKAERAEGRNRGPGR